MRFKFIFVVLLLYGIAACAYQSEFRSVIEKRDIASIRVQFVEFFDYWKNSEDPKGLEHIANADELYTLCVSVWNDNLPLKYIGLSIAKLQELTDLEKLQINVSGIMFAVIAVGYLEKNPIAVDFSENLKRNADLSDKSKSLLQIWNETLNDFINEKASAEARTATNRKDVLSYFMTILEEKQYLHDTKSQYVVNIIAQCPQILTKDEGFEKHKEQIVKMIEQQFDQLPQDSENIHEKSWRGQQAFILLHKCYSSPRQHINWIKNIIETKKIPKRLRDALVKNIDEELNSQ